MDLYIDIMCEILSLSKDEVESAEYKKNSEWTSFNHLLLIAEIENRMGCTFNRSEIMRFKNFFDGIEILKEKGIL